jgi:hypothetical protein
MEEQNVRKSYQDSLDDQVLSRSWDINEIWEKLKKAVNKALVEASGVQTKES